MLHAAMQNTLADGLGAICDVWIFRDGDHDTGMGHGHDWKRSIVANLAGSMLFFWNQTPRWVESAYCRFEMDVFRANVVRLARRFSTPSGPIDPERLFERLVIPIRHMDMDVHQWAAQPADTVAQVRPLWRRTNIFRELDLSKGDCRASDIPLRCLAAEAHIRRDIFAAVPEHVSLPELLDFLATEDRSFIHEWSRRFPADEGAVLPPAMPELSRQGHLARLRTGGRLHDEDASLGLNYFLVPLNDAGTEGFWASARPLGNPLAARISAMLPEAQRPRVAPDGQLVWSAAAVARIRDMLVLAGTDIPGAAQAAALQGLDPTVRCKMGWLSPPRRFWFASPDGAIEPAEPAGRALPVMLARPVS